MPLPIPRTYIRKQWPDILPTPDEQRDVFELQHRRHISQTPRHLTILNPNPGGPLPRTQNAASEDLRTSKTLPVPTAGRKIYVRLWTMLNGTWTEYNAYIFATKGPSAP
jgi:hypothetical protein